MITKRTRTVLPRGPSRTLMVLWLKGEGSSSSWTVQAIKLWWISWTLGAHSFGMTGAFFSEDYFAFFCSSFPFFLHLHRSKGAEISWVKSTCFGLFLFPLFKRAKTTKYKKGSSYLPSDIGLFSCWAEEIEIVFFISQRQDAEELLFKSCCARLDYAQVISDWHCTLHSYFCNSSEQFWSLCIPELQSVITI